MENYKYSWLEEEIRTNTNKQVLRKETNGRTHGAISCPTGYGKSGIIFDDVIWHIKDAKEKDCKLIVNISAPILLLCCQNISDLLELIVHTQDIHGVSKNEILCVKNNSGDVDDMNSHGIDTIEIDKFEREFAASHYKVAIVISCNKSLDKFTDFLKTNVFSNCIVCTYLDEAHTLSIKDENSLIEGDTVQKVDLVELSAKSNYCYLISATNKQELVKLVNSFESSEEDDTYIYKVDPKDAIGQNIICGPAMSCYSYSNDANFDNVVLSQCKQFYSKVVSDNTKIHHKILVSVNDTESAEKYAKALAKIGHTVFLTTAATRQRCYRGKADAVKNTYKDYKNVLDFSNDIKNFSGHCFVIHIRQLISGIDIAGLSDCIIFKNELSDEDYYDTMIQTVGRCLRLGDERGIDSSSRKKKYANVLFVTTQNGIDAENDLSKFFINYYGVNCIMFNCGFASDSRKSQYDDIEKEDFKTFKFNYVEGNNAGYMAEVHIRVENWIKDFLIPSYENAKSLGLEYKIPDIAINSIISQAKEFDNKKYYTTAFFDNDRCDLRKFIFDTFNNYKNNHIFNM